MLEYSTNTYINGRHFILDGFKICAKYLHNVKM